jgi:hypothetical protein
MIAIPENTIDSVINKYEDENAYLEDLKILGEQQPDLLSFIDQENYSLLKNDEIALMEYLTVVIYSSVLHHLKKIIIIPAKQLETAEEENWSLFNGADVKVFHKILDKAFLDYDQEDLLALVEDSIQTDEEDIISPIGKEIIFVACKSIIDTIHKFN